MTETGESSRVMAVGESALSGWRGAAAGVIAKPVARRSRFTEDQIKAFLGFALLAYAFYRLARPLVRAWRS